MFRKGYLWFCVSCVRYGAIFGGSVSCVRYGAIFGGPMFCVLSMGYHCFMCWLGIKVTKKFKWKTKQKSKDWFLLPTLENIGALTLLIVSIHYL